MSRGNRNIFFAVGLVAAVTFVIGWLTLPILPTTQHFEYGAPRNENYQPGGGKCERAALAKVADANVRLDQTEDCQKEAEEYRHNSDDLVQQTRAANAAQAQADIASQQLWMGWLQTIGGFLTLAAAVGAAVYAREAARHTRDANRIAVDSQRAWVTLSIQPKLIGPAAKDGVRFEIDFFAENIGGTVATHFDFECDVMFVGRGEAVPEISARVQRQIEEWASQCTMIEGSNLIPTSIETESFRRDKQSHMIRWWSVIPQSTEVCQPIFIAAVLYRTVADPKIMQVSWRTWYLSEKTVAGGPTTFVRKHTPVLECHNIFVEPFGTTLMHRKFPPA